MTLPLPPVVLLDLDDTIVDDSGTGPGCWLEACASQRGALGGLTPETLDASIREARRWFWADRERHRVGRLDLPAARALVTRIALFDHGIDDPALAERIATEYGALRDRTLRLLDGALETVLWLRERGCRLGLVTNGAADAQRYKIDRFDLAGHFEAIFIEGELGFGKPDPRVFRRALETFGVDPADAWMIGDNLEWDVAPPQSLGMRGLWIDGRGDGLPAGHSVQPDRVLRSLADLRNGA